MAPEDRWRRLLDERLAEAVAKLGVVPGVHGLIVGGSLGRGEPWPLSDIDILPVYTASTDPATELEMRRAGTTRAAVGSARARHGRRRTDEDLAEAIPIRGDDPARSTRLLREPASALRLVLIEAWGERLGSMGREWTRFEHIAERHASRDLAIQLAASAGFGVVECSARATAAPTWLRERIDLSYTAPARSARTSPAPRTPPTPPWTNTSRPRGADLSTPGLWTQSIDISQKA